MVRRGNRNQRAIETQPELHTAVDFGTTFTAAALAIPSLEIPSQSLRDIHPITEYPEDEGGKDVNQVPTLVLYKLGEKAAVAWGWQALRLYKQNKSGYVLAARFKLLLSERDNTKHIRKDLRRDLLIDGRTEVDLFVDFLRPLRQFILERIAQQEGSESATWKRRWTLTVPADWSAPARRFMLEVADMAGFEGPVKLISEPEAAGLYILEQRAEGKRKLTLEAAAVVGDLGGGTCDCATFLVSTLDPLSLTGISTVKGVTCGAGNLFDGLRRLLSDRLKDVAQQYLEGLRGQSLEQILDDTIDQSQDTIKTFQYSDHTPDMEASETFVVSGLREDFESGFIASGVNVSRRELCEVVFEPVVRSILELLRDQIKASIHSRNKSMNRSGKFNIEHLFLTGGLSRNKYVFDRVRTTFDKNLLFPKKIEVLRPRDPDIAVVRGAVWRSLHPEKLPVRLSDTSYGFRRDESYDESWAYGGPGPVNNPVTGMPEMKDRMKWVIKKDHKQRLGFSSYRLERYVPVGGDLEFRESMYYSDTVSQDHVHYECGDIHEFGQIKFNLEKWREQFTVIRDGLYGRPYMIIKYLLLSTIDEDQWSYEIQVLGSKTGIKDGGRITAGFKLSQGFIAE